jgi:hypothetical protein
VPNLLTLQCAVPNHAASGITSFRHISGCPFFYPFARNPVPLAVAFRMTDVVEARKPWRKLRRSSSCAQKTRNNPAQSVLLYAGDLCVHNGINKPVSFVCFRFNFVASTEFSRLEDARGPKVFAYLYRNCPRNLLQTLQMRGRRILNSTMVIFQWTRVYDFSGRAHSGIDSSSETGWTDRKVYCSLAVILPPTSKLSILI